ncbi:unnamed protein product [Mytilus edulis]|uniref:Uncharacterized protein n=1 Tax=Mytilus edulis TaxID=6550 RepID=A0A8S3RVD1_MYTED|nr:unnamed protein product [Mytilus edulis]
MIASSDRQKRQYDHKINARKYSVGDAVWVFTQQKQKAYTDLIYKVESSPNSRDRVLHHDRLKPFIGNFNNWLQKSKDDLDKGDSKDPAVETEIIEKKQILLKRVPEILSPRNVTVPLTKLLARYATKPIRYKDLPSLRRHTRYAHGSEFVQCQFCQYEVPANVKHRLKFHEERRHGIKKTSQKLSKRQIKYVAKKVTSVEKNISTVHHFQKTPVRSRTPVYVDMPSINLTPDEEMMFLGRPLKTGSPVESMSLLDRPRPDQTVPSPLIAPQTITAPVPVPDVSVQPVVKQPIQPLPVTITPSSVMQPYLTVTPQPAAVQPVSPSTQPLPVTITPYSMVQPYFTVTPQPAAVQLISPSTQPLPVTITPSSMMQPYFTVTPQPAGAICAIVST